MDTPILPDHASVTAPCPYRIKVKPLSEEPKNDDPGPNPNLPALCDQMVAKMRCKGSIQTGHPKVIYLDPTKRFDPVAFIVYARDHYSESFPKSIEIDVTESRNWSLWKGPADQLGSSGEEDVDERSSALDRIDVSRIMFETCLNDGEVQIFGEEKMRRLKLMPRIRLGGNAFEGLLCDYHRAREASCLEWLRECCGITYLDFFGTVLRSPWTNRCILYLHWKDKGWHWGWNCCCLDSRWGAGFKTATLKIS